MTITPAQARAARAHLDLTQQQIADVVGLEKNDISRFEKGRTVKASKINDIVQYYKSCLRFTDHGGVEPIPKEGVRSLSGSIGFRALMDEVYAYAKNNGGQLEIFNGSPDLFIKWLGEDWYAMHANRMREIKHKIRFRIITHEDQKELIAGSFAEYRKISKDQFNKQTIYLYGNNAAVFTFSEDDVKINVFTGSGLIQTLRMAFDMFWEKAK